MSESIRILVVGGVEAAHLRARLGQRREPRFTAAGPVAPADAARTSAEQRPDLVVVAVGAEEVPNVVTLVRTGAPGAKILVAGHPTGRLSSAALAAGACGILAPDLGDDALREALLRASAGELILEDRDLRDAIGLDELSARPRGGPALTVRELEVLRATADGLGTYEIAVRLDISAGTVRAHVKSILSKLQVHSKVEAVRLAWREGLVAAPA